MTDMTERSYPTGSEKDLFQLIKKDANGIRNIHDLKKFFKRRLSSRLFDVNCGNENGLTPLMFVACDCQGIEHVSAEEELNQMEVILILLAHGADVNIEANGNNNMLGMTALNYACESSSSSVVNLLLSHGANPDLENAKGLTPLLHSSERAEYDSMKALLECGLDVNFYNNDYGFAPIHMLFKGNVNIPYLDIIRGVKLLLEYGADIDLEDAYGTTLLFLAVHEYGMIDSDEELALDFIRYLLDLNADSSIQMTEDLTMSGYANRVGDTPLHDADRYENVKVVQLLLEYHPNLSIRNGDYETALDLAKKLQFSDIVQLIEEEHRQQIYKYLISRWASLPKEVGVITSRIDSKRKFDQL